MSSNTIDPLPIIEQDMKNCQASDLHRHSAARDTTPEDQLCIDGESAMEINGKMVHRKCINLTVH